MSLSSHNHLGRTHSPCLDAVAALFVRLQAGDVTKFPRRLLAVRNVRIGQGLYKALRNTTKVAILPGSPTT